MFYVGYVYWDSEEIYLGYVMIDIKRYVFGFVELIDEEVKVFGFIISRVSKVLKESEGVEYIYIFVLGNGVLYMYMYIILCYVNILKEFWLLIEIVKWIGVLYGEVVKIKKLCERI